MSTRDDLDSSGLPHGFDLVTLPELPNDPAHHAPMALLQKACSGGDLARVKEIFETWASTPELDPKDMDMALAYAAGRGHYSIVQILLEYGAPVTGGIGQIATDEKVHNALDILKILFEYGWSIEDSTPKGGGLSRMTMNNVMRRHDGEALLQWFLANGAPVNGIPSDPVRPLRVAAGSAPSLRVIRLLLSHGATIQHTGALHYATLNRSDGRDELSMAIMNLLLDEGIDIDELEYEGWGLRPRYANSSYTDWGTALHTAAQEGSLSKARLLVERGADLQKRSRHGYTARDRAQLCEHGNVREYLEEVMMERGLEIQELEMPEKNSDDDEIPTWRALD